MKKKLHVIGGGTFSHVRCHLSLAAPAFGKTARQIYERFTTYQRRFATQIMYSKLQQFEVQLHLTAMASAGESKLVTNADVANLVEKLVADPDTVIIIFNPAMCDYQGSVANEDGSGSPSGKYETRLKSSEGKQTLTLVPAEKLIGKIRKQRKDIFLVGFKTTAGASEDEQYFAGLRLLKDNSCNLVLANDVITRNNMIITPEEARYHVTTDRDEAIEGLLEMTIARYGLDYNRTEIVPGDIVPWNSERIPESLRTVVDWCIENGAYKPIRGKTVGHYSFRESEDTYLVSRRKVNYLEDPAMVEVEIDDEYKIKAQGSKPSAGAQTQRLIFQDHPEYDCIVHFHCPMRPFEEGGGIVPVRSQYKYECGSIQCGTNTSRGLKKFGNLSAVMLDQHGPNIVFHHSIDPQEVIYFIEKNFDLSKKTGGYQPAWAD